MNRRLLAITLPVLTLLVFPLATGCDKPERPEAYGTRVERLPELPDKPAYALPEGHENCEIPEDDFF